MKIRYLMSAVSLESYYQLITRFSIIKYSINYISHDYFELQALDLISRSELN